MSNQQLCVFSFTGYQPTKLCAFVHIGLKGGKKRIVRTELSCEEEYPRWAGRPIQLSGSNENSTLLFEITAQNDRSLGVASLKLSIPETDGSYLLPVSSVVDDQLQAVYLQKEAGLITKLQDWLRSNHSNLETMLPVFKGMYAQKIALRQVETGTEAKVTEAKSVAKEAKEVRAEMAEKVAEEMKRKDVQAQDLDAETLETILFGMASWDSKVTGFLHIAVIHPS